MKIFTMRPASLFSQKFLSAFVAILLLFVQSVHAQEYASSQTSVANPASVVVAIVEITAPASVVNPANALGAPDANFSELSVSGIKATSAITLSSNASLSLTMPSTIPAGKHTFVRLDLPQPTGLNLDLSSIVNVLGLLQNNTIRVTTDAGTASRALVRDPSGAYFLEVTSTLPYSIVTVTLDFAGIGGLAGVSLSTLKMRVYHAVTYENTTYSACTASPLFSGIDPSAGLLSANLVSLEAPQNAIDGNINTASTFSKNANAAGTVGQSFFLGKTAASNAEITVALSRPAGLLDVDLLAGINVQAYNGATLVRSESISSLLLGVQLLNFENFQPSNLVFNPGGAFDRIVISQSAVASALVTLNLHEVAARAPITFTGGVLSSAIAGSGPITRTLNNAVGSIALGLPGFSIGCGTFGEYTYQLFEVNQGARTLAGTLPSTLSLSTDGTLSGNPTATQFGLYNFDVQATNSFGQTAVATFSIRLFDPLPVTLVSFKAVAEGTTASLSWSTSMETNSDRFDVERSGNGKNWATIGSVRSNQESNTLKNYSFTDAAPLDGQNLYRLKMIDLDETFAYSSIQNVSFEGTAFVYPNPVRAGENIQLNLTDWSAINAVKVVNAAGQVVFESANALSTGISARNLTAGVYVLQVVRKDGSTTAHKFIRQ